MTVPFKPSWSSNYTSDLSPNDVLPSVILHCSSRVSRPLYRYCFSPHIDWLWNESVGNKWLMQHLRLFWQTKPRMMCHVPRMWDPLGVNGSIRSNFVMIVLECYKAWLVALSNRKEYRINSDETFASCSKDDHSSPLVITCHFLVLISTLNGCKECTLTGRPQGYEASIWYASSIRWLS